MAKKKARTKEHDKSKHNTSVGLEENIEALLTYVLAWVTGLVFFLIEKKSDFVRFHAAQSLITFLGLWIISMVLGRIPILGVILVGLITILEIILWILLMIKAYQHERFKLPIVGDLAENLAKKKV